MSSKNNRRDFIKKVSWTGLGLGVASGLSPLSAEQPGRTIVPATIPAYRQSDPSLPFIPRRVASWWVTIEELAWAQKDIRDEIKRRAAAFAEAGIDTAIIFGWHIRFDFANYFGRLHGYMAEVADELHKYGIKFMDHYSCNHTERPRDKAEFEKLHRGQRHHALLFHDEIALNHAQYEGYLFNDICEIDLRDGSRGYARQYQMEAFCHNNPGFLDMHAKYLQRLIKEVDIDGAQVDDMCDYPGLTTCGCKFCRDRFRKDYGHEIPPFSDKSFFGDTSKPMLQWGNYENPVFRDWIHMKSDSVADHVRLVKSILGDRPLMSCCSSTGPVILNAVSLDLEKMSPYLDFFMLENVGTNIRGVNWVDKDAEALNQKDIAAWRGDAVAMALSYTIYEKGGYLGWALSRFWGVANWSSTLVRRLEEDPDDAMQMEDVIRRSNQWEIKHSNLDFREGKDVVELRVVNNKFCKDNGWKDDKGKEHWDRAEAWAIHLVESNVGYRFVRFEELADQAALSDEKTPLVLDGVACVSDKQFAAVSAYLKKGGTAWIALPFGIYNERGVKRDKPLSEALLSARHKNLIQVKSSLESDSISELIAAGKFRPVLRQVSGDKGWAARLRIYGDKPVIHFMNMRMKAVGHPTVKDVPGVPILTDIKSEIANNKLSYEIDSAAINLNGVKLLSPELDDSTRSVNVSRSGKLTRLSADLDGINVYAVAHA